MRLCCTKCLQCCAYSVCTSTAPSPHKRTRVSTCGTVSLRHAGAPGVRLAEDKVRGRRLCERETDRERERESMCVYAHVYVCVCACGCGTQTHVRGLCICTFVARVASLMLTRSQVLSHRRTFVHCHSRTHTDTHTLTYAHTHIIAYTHTHTHIHTYTGAHP